jgi:hypothetical protein
LKMPTTGTFVVGFEAKIKENEVLVPSLIE